LLALAKRLRAGATRDALDSLYAGRDVLEHVALSCLAAVGDGSAWEDVLVQLEVQLARLRPHGGLVPTPVRRGLLQPMATRPLIDHFDDLLRFCTVRSFDYDRRSPAVVAVDYLARHAPEEKYRLERLAQLLVNRRGRSLNRTGCGWRTSGRRWTPTAMHSSTATCTLRASTA
jgi:hypothetical protein